MSWKAYPAYKSSGVEWLGDVPEHWNDSRLSFLFTRTNAGEVIDKTFWGEGCERLYTCARQPLYSDFPYFPTDKRTTKRDLLLTRNGTPYVHKPSANAIYSNVVQRISLKLGFDRDYISYALGAACLGLRGYGVSIESLNFEMWKSLRVAFPSEKEQIAIATFLDRETARIDSLIEKKQRQIELLQEKRSALISHAVTKGLDPNVKMKDSGVAWLGDVPEHWTKIRLGYSAQMIVPMRDKPQVFSGDVPWIRIEDFEGKYIGDSKTEQRVDIDTIRYMNLKIFPIGTVLCSCSCRMGVTAIVSRPLVTNQTFIGIVPGELIYSDFLYYLMQAIAERLQIAATGAIQQYLAREDFQQLRFFSPSIIEQQMIAAFLDHETTKIDTLVEKVQESIEKLREYRTALISAAVTGKIDVRDEASA